MNKQPIRLTKEELGALRHFCYRNIFELEPIAFSGKGSEYTEEQAKQALKRIERNYDLICKLSVMEWEVTE